MLAGSEHEHRPRCRLSDRTRSNCPRGRGTGKGPPLRPRTPSHPGPAVCTTALLRRAQPRFAHVCFDGCLGLFVLPGHLRLLSLRCDESVAKSSSGRSMQGFAQTRSQEHRHNDAHMGCACTQYACAYASTNSCMCMKARTHPIVPHSASRSRHGNRRGHKCKAGNTCESQQRKSSCATETGRTEMEVASSKAV